MKKILLAVISAALLLSVVSCGSSKVETTSPEWVPLSTENATQNYGKFYTSEELGKFSSLEVDFKKESGNEGSCFGLIFGYSEPDNGILVNYVRFEINALGEYAVYTWDGAKYADILDSSAVNTAYLVESSSISKGLSATNKLKIDVDAKGAYSCTINGTKVASGITPMKDATYGAMAFFSVGKAEEENFPDAPVKVSYCITGSTSK